MEDMPRVRVCVTFLSAAEGGRQSPVLDQPLYRPHIVIGDPGQRRATADEDGFGNEEYLGIWRIHI